MRVQKNKLKVIIADSSTISRLVLCEMVQAQPDLEVLETAADGTGLMNALQFHEPDVVVANYDLPEIEHALNFRQIYRQKGVPVLMMLKKQQVTDGLMSEISGMGVYDYILQPDYHFQPGLRTLQAEIINKIRAVQQVRPYGFSAPDHTVFFPELNASALNQIPEALIVIGASTGGPQAVEKVVAGLDPALNACILIAVHMPAGFTKSFARRLQFHTALKVVEARAGTRILKGKVIIAPGGKNMVVTPVLGEENSLKVAFTSAEPNEFDLPSVNMLMNSVAQHPAVKTMGVILTGMGEDGVSGLKAIGKAGGCTVAQDEASSAIFGMAKAAIKQGCVKEILDLKDIPLHINRFVKGTVSDAFNRNSVK